MKSVRVDRGDSNNSVFEEAADRINSGKLVAFPTETVYGLGGDGLNKEAVCAIFDMKKRPLDDPVILHVNTASAALELWNLSPKEKAVIEVLQKEFWPGPITIIAPASVLIPPEVTSNTGRVAVRCPSHPVARRLIDVSKRPIAAPSANLFSRISPTRAEHVRKYFSDQDLLIIECDDCCDIGIESTVLSVEDRSVRILRSGAITSEDVQRVLADQNIKVVAKELDSIITTRPSSSEDQFKASVDSSAKSAPGQSLVHYAPTLTTYLCIDGPPKNREISKSAIIDMSGVFDALKDRARSYRSITETGDPHSVARNLFACLHEVEDSELAEELLICISKDDLYKAEYAGVLDRSIRASAHRVLHSTDT